MACISPCDAAMALRNLSSSHRRGLVLASQFAPYQISPRFRLARPVVVFSRRRNSNPGIAGTKKKKNFSHDTKEEDIDEDAIEALFTQLEEDLKNDGISADDNGEEISEEDLAKLERELEEALGEDDELSSLFTSSVDDLEADNYDGHDVADHDHDDEEEEEELRAVKLKNWQLRRMASALKVGRRKTSIKSLAAELCLDRTVVLELLRDPPPNLLLMTAALPDKKESTVSVQETKEFGNVIPLEATTNSTEPETSKKVPVHVMQGQWSAQKRLKKVQVETLERVYRRTKRPTNAMISSIVQVTNLPRKRVVKWFEDKRSEDGVPDQRRPFQRPGSGAVLSR